MNWNSLRSWPNLKRDDGGPAVGSGASLVAAAGRRQRLRPPIGPAG